MSPAASHPPIDRRTVRPRPNPRLTEAEMIASVRETSEPGVWKVRSRSHPGISYTVRRGDVEAGETADLECSCPATRHCWHMTAVSLFHAAMLSSFDPFDDADRREREAWDRIPKLSTPATFAEPETICLTPAEVKAIQPRMVAPVGRWEAPADHYKLLSDFCDDFAVVSVFSS